MVEYHSPSGVVNDLNIFYVIVMNDDSYLSYVCRGGAVVRQQACGVDFRLWHCYVTTLRKLLTCWSFCTTAAKALKKWDGGGALRGSSPVMKVEGCLIPV